MTEEKPKELIALDPNVWGEELIKTLTPEYPIVYKLFDVIDENIEPPFSISINGCWGSGKTTFLLLLKNTFEEKGYKTIWFNPWEYERTDDVVLAFMQKLVLEFKNNFGIKELGIFAITLGITGIDLASKILTGGMFSYRDAKEISKDARNALEKEYESYEDITKAIKEDFSRITNDISSKDGKPLIVFLDDLDRCLPDRALELLEAIKNFLVVENAKVVFISGIDTDVVKKFINQKYHKIEGNFAINYFKKIFNLTINIPKFNIRKITEVLNRNIVDLFKITPDITDLISKRIINLCVFAGINSFRSIFNILNNLFIIYKFADNKEEIIESKISETKNGEKYFLFDIIIYILVIKENWNEFYEQMVLEVRKNNKETFGTLTNNKNLHEAFMNKDFVLNDFLKDANDKLSSYTISVVLEKYFLS